MTMDMNVDGQREERRRSARHPVPELLIELRRNVDSATPDWAASAVDISLRGMLLQLPPVVALGEYLHLRFMQRGPLFGFERLGAVVLRHEHGNLVALGFTGWPREALDLLAAWLPVIDQ